MGSFRTGQFFVLATYGDSFSGRSAYASIRGESEEVLLQPYSPGNGDITVFRSGVGSYRVVFPGVLRGTVPLSSDEPRPWHWSPNVQVTPWDFTGEYFTASIRSIDNGFSIEGQTDLVVRVNTYGADGNPKDGAFSILVTWPE